MKWCHFAKF